MAKKGITRSIIKALMLIVSGALLITAGALVGSTLSRQAPETPRPTLVAAAIPEVLDVTPEPPAPSVSPAEANEVSSVEVETISPACRMIWVTRFTLCGHEYQAPRQARELIGLTRQEAELAVKDWSLQSFSRDEIRFMRDSENFCPDHLVLKRNEKGLGVYQTDIETLKSNEIMAFTIDLSMLDDEKQLLLGQGMPFTDLHEIEGYIEDLES